VQAGLQLDLDARLHFTHGWLVVTNRRLIGQAPGEKDLQSWDIAPGMTLAHRDHAGVGTLELSDGQHRLASWRYTLGHNTDALRLADAFDAQRDA
ncbi:ABC transporter, partial [Pandoraea pneumonica]